MITFQEGTPQAARYELFAVFNKEDKERERERGLTSSASDSIKMGSGYGMLVSIASHLEEGPELITDVSGRKLHRDWNIHRSVAEEKEIEGNQNEARI